ncbi:bifunctional UDP-N-acetylglucosamine diphosphorylase/glucosamine-1-phosphate N-acetyltransferase GlmU [Alkanindiges sp. WGS2144]|uniref:bifunctional UDP-N-acetylglucosamine diphosphorylase/glucosamine-1-phosphate N-acetyltransferase GlmU n=1 Tax=Alkanindiges sp. WGS2144 TaxID=3366808 RepID=UPI003753740D
MTLSVIILAAGKGTRMNSRLPKVLQPLAGKPLLGHVLEQAAHLQAERIIAVIGHGSEQVKAAFADQPVQWVEQTEQLGTGHAVQVTLPVLPATGQSLILYGDVPLIRAETLQQLQAAASSGIAMMTLTVDNPTGYGRIVRDSGKIQRIVEHKDATEQQRQINEVNTGIYCVDNACLHRWLPKLSNNNAQGEYYLTDIVEMAVADGLDIGSVQPEFDFEVEGVNDRLQLANLERRYQVHQAEQLLKAGVTLADPARFDLRGCLSTGQDVRIDVNVIIEGDCHLGDGVHIGAGCVLKNVRIGADTIILPYSILDTVTVGAEAHVGPFARLRPGTLLANQVHVGNFVEIKNSQVGTGSKANHLAYIGDAVIGSGSNIGAGTITCNYDGANKHKTIIGDQAFIGSNSSLVAPVSIGHGATVGAGSVVTKEVPQGTLAVARGQQRHIENYQRPVKK